MHALQRWPDWVTSGIAAVECRRAMKRGRASAAVSRRAEAVLDRVTLIKVDEAVLRLASQIGSPVLRSLDAVHLATAMSMGDDPAAFVTYDDRLAIAARALKLSVLQPGR
jgi:predicted nucleic acid-binding protein